MVENISQVRKQKKRRKVALKAGGTNGKWETEMSSIPRH